MFAASPIPGIANAPTTSSYLAQLSDQQHQAVKFGISGADTAETGPLFVLAGVGSGRMHILGWRAACLVTNGADPQHILLLTLSCRAAGEPSNHTDHLPTWAMQGE